MFVKVFEMVAAFRAGDYKRGVTILLEILLEGVKTLDSNKVRAALVDGQCASLSDEELLSALDGHCAAAKVAGATSDPTKGGGAFIIILPLLIELFKRFILKV